MVTGVAARCRSCVPPGSGGACVRQSGNPAPCAQDGARLHGGGAAEFLFAIPRGNLWGQSIGVSMRASTPIGARHARIYAGRPVAQPWPGRRSTRAPMRMPHPYRTNNPPKWPAASEVLFTHYALRITFGIRSTTSSPASGASIVTMNSTGNDVACSSSPPIVGAMTVSPPIVLLRPV